ncbi:MAG: alpha/beta hydrolase [Dehalococcoidia bacterium]
MALQEKLGGMPLFDAARAAGVQFAAEALPEDKFVTVHGMRFHYLDWGKEGRPKMLALHGGAQTAHMWDFFSLAMRADWHIVALDQRGHGDSDWAEDGDYDTAAHVRDIAAITDAIGFGRFDLLGLSMGGRNAYGFTAAHPDKVRSLVIVDVGPEIEVEGRKHIQEFLEDTEVFESFDWLVERVKQYNHRRVEDQIRGSLINNLRQMDDGRWTWKYDRRRGIRRDRGGEITEGAWDDIRSIRCRTLIVRGAESDIFSPQTARKMLDAIPGSQMAEIPRAGHLVPGDNPVAFEEAVRRFLAGL